MLNRVKGTRSETSKQNPKKRLPITRQSKQYHFQGKTKVSSKKSPNLSNNRKRYVDIKNSVSLSIDTVSFITVGGLKNFGNTCYLNSALQMLRSLATVWQMHLKKSIDDPFAKIFKNIMDHDGDTSSHLQLVLHEMHVRNAQFTPGMQQDVHEAIQFILHELCAIANIICTCFTFNMKTKVRCCHCNKFTHRIEPCIFLKVPLSKITKPVPLQNYIQQSLIGEKLTGENAYQCDNGNDKIDATTERTIMDSPEILFIQLLRFSNDSTKLNADVTVQDVIYINDYPYQLKSAICHIGLNLGVGHYIAFTNINGEWFNCNDNVVTNCKYTDVNGKEVYILSYEKIINT